jgi:hypothetical protein
VSPVASRNPATWGQLTGQLQWVPSRLSTFLLVSSKSFVLLFLLFIFYIFVFSTTLYLFLSPPKLNLDRETSFSFQFVAAQHVASVFNFSQTQNKTLTLSNRALFFFLDLWRTTKNPFYLQISDL